MKKLIAINAKISGAIRQDTIDGRAYTVVPFVALVEGVHNARYYPRNEIEKYPESWNGRPIPVFHPEDNNGDPISANAPEILESNTIGQVFNMKTEDGKLIGEMWFENEKANSIAPEVLSIINSGRQLEISTGLFADSRGGEGDYNGEHYDTTLVNYRPDHVAVLPGGQGACNWADGCGAPRTNCETCDKKNKKPEQNQNDPETIIRKVAGLIRGLFQNHKANDKTDPDKSDRETVQTLMKEIGRPFIINEVSIDKTLDQIRAWVNGQDRMPNVINYLRATFETYFVYNKMTRQNDAGPVSDKLYKRSYTVDGNGAVIIGEDETEVREDTKFVPVTAPNTNNQTINSKENESMKTKKEKIDALIANQKTPFKKEHETFLNTLSEEELDMLAREEAPAGDPPAPPAPPAPTDPPKPAGNEKKKEQTDEEYINNAPPKVRAILNAAIARDKAIKDKTVKAILANENNKFSEAELNKMELPMLQNILAVAGDEIEEDDYTGQGGTQTVVNEEEAMPIPVVLERKN